MTARDKYLERQRRYNASAKGRARWLRYRHSHIEQVRDLEARRVRFYGGGISWSEGYLPTHEAMAAWVERRDALWAEFNAKQAEDRRTFNTYLDQLSGEKILSLAAEIWPDAA